MLIQVYFIALICKQLKEMSESTKPSTSDKESDSDKKKGFADWMNLVKPGYEEKDHWVRSYYFNSARLQFHDFLSYEGN